MENGKLVVLTRPWDPELWDIFVSRKPSGFQITVIDPEDGEPKAMKELEDLDYLLSMLDGRVSGKMIENAKKLKLIQTIGQDTSLVAVK